LSGSHRSRPPLFSRSRPYSPQTVSLFNRTSTLNGSWICASIRMIITTFFVENDHPQVGWITMIACNAPPYAVCFLYRYQVVLLPGSRLKLSRTTKTVLVVILYIYFFSHGIVLWVRMCLVFKIHHFTITELSNWPPSISASVNCFNENILIPVYMMTISVCLCIITLTAIFEEV
ncbi:hypothetical protein PFISCL1PPCAC_14503, partial [Pristionchus fissidentatus]